MEKVLQLVFKKADGKQKVLNVTDPREGVTGEEARTAMQNIVDSGVFSADGNALALTTLRLVKNVLKFPVDTALMYLVLKFAEARLAPQLRR